MNNRERYEYFESGKLQRAVQIELLDWAGYWAEFWPDGLDDELLKLQTKEAVSRILSDLATMTKKVSRLAISADAIKSADPDGVTDAIIHTVVVQIMARRLAWLTGITEVPPEPEPEPES